MLLSPSYDAAPALSVEVRASGPHPIIGQRERLGDLLGQLHEDEWRAPSRCDAWTVQDVVTHLNSTNGFWTLSIGQALAGEPTRFLAAFDPVATPAQMVEGTRGTPPADTMAAYLEGLTSLRAAVEGLDEQSWETLGEAPPGHVPLRLVADHALWDCWIHERDIALPLGRPPVEDAAEVLTCLRYAAALGRVFALQHGAGGEGAAEVRVTAPDDRLVVEAGADLVRVHDGPAPPGARVVDLPAVVLLEMLSMRDVGEAVPDTVRWLTAGLATVFDQTEVAETA
jgi:uncharacterized protein (TIGR03083 family)